MLINTNNKETYTKTETDALLANKEDSISVLPLNKGGTGSGTYHGARENLGFKRVICPAGQSVSINISNDSTYILSASDNVHVGVAIIQTNSSSLVGIKASVDLISLINWSYSASNGVLTVSETGGSYGVGVGVSYIAWNQGY